MWSGTSFVVLICFALILSEEEEEKGASEDEMTGWHHWWKWTWTWEDFRRWWGTGRPDVLRSMGSQSQTRLGNWTTREIYIYISHHFFIHSSLMDTWVVSISLLLWIRCNKYGSIGTSPGSCFHFLWLYTQKLDFWIIWHLYFLFFEKLIYCFSQINQVTF